MMTISEARTGAHGNVDPRVYQALAVASALRLYARTGMKANRAYTPTQMMLTAQRITGQVFKPHAYMVAAAALTAWCAKYTGE